jgi:hypothetical protein
MASAVQSRPAIAAEAQEMLDRVQMRFLIHKLEPVLSEAGGWYVRSREPTDDPPASLSSFLRFNRGGDTPEVRRAMAFLTMQWQDMKGHKRMLPVKSLVHFQAQRSEVMIKSELAYLRGMYQVAFARTVHAPLQRVETPAQRAAIVLDQLMLPFMLHSATRPYRDAFELLRLFQQRGMVDLQDPAMIRQECALLRTETLNMLAEAQLRCYPVDRSQPLIVQLQQAETHLPQARDFCGRDSWPVRSLTEMTELLKASLQETRAEVALRSLPPPGARYPAPKYVGPEVASAHNPLKAVPVSNRPVSTYLPRSVPLDRAQKLKQTEMYLASQYPPELVDHYMRRLQEIETLNASIEIDQAKIKTALGPAQVALRAVAQSLPPGPLGAVPALRAEAPMRAASKPILERAARAAVKSLAT